MSSYGFDLAFKSNVTPSITPADKANPIAMAFGYSGGGKEETGEKSKLKIASASTVSFQLYDLDTPNTSPVSTVTIRFHNLKEDAPIQCPFIEDAWSKNEITFHNQEVPGNPKEPAIYRITLPPPEPIVSNGCNIVAAAGFTIGGRPSTQYTVGNFETLERFMFSATVTLQDGTVFRVDPEMDVMGDGS